MITEVLEIIVKIWTWLTNSIINIVTTPEKIIPIALLIIAGFFIGIIKKP